MFSLKQKQILAFPDSKYDALICDGSVRSGKTSVMSTAFILWAMRDFDGCAFGICSKTVSACMRNVIRPIMAMSYLNSRFKISLKRSSGEMIITDGRKTNIFYVFGGKDESSYQLIQGITLAGVFLDEVALMPRSFVEQALARCSIAGRRFWFNCNPENQLHWFHTEWIQCLDKHNALRLHFRMEDNPSLSEKIRKDYESMYSGIFYQRYILGEWVSADGLIYDMFDRAKHVPDTVPETEGEYFVSCDFGIQNATVFLLWRKLKHEDKWICLREWYYSGRDNRLQKTVTQLSEGLKQMLGEIVPKQIIIDPSAAALIAELRRNGYHVLSANNDVIDGISDVSTMLHAGRLLFSEECRHTLDEFGIYAWDAKAAEHGIDRPIKENDHAMDAVRYFVKTKRLVKKKDTTEYSYF